MNQEKINPVVKICENLPLDLTLFEKDGCCQKSDHICKYNKDRVDLSSDNRFCYKKTFTNLPLLRSTI